MKFFIEKTSGRDVSKIKNVKLGTFTKTETRICGSFEEFDKNFSESEGAWLSTGSNHRVVRGEVIKRDFKDELERYFIEVETLEELIDIKKEYGDLIIRSSYNNDDIMVIEIYDTYRE